MRAMLESVLRLGHLPRATSESWRSGTSLVQMFGETWTLAARGASALVVRGDHGPHIEPEKYAASEDKRARLVAAFTGAGDEPWDIPARKQLDAWAYEPRGPRLPCPQCKGSKFAPCSECKGERIVERACDECGETHRCNCGCPPQGYPCVLCEWAVDERLDIEPGYIRRMIVDRRRVAAVLRHAPPGTVSVGSIPWPHETPGMRLLRLVGGTEWRYLLMPLSHGQDALRFTPEVDECPF